MPPRRELLAFVATLAALVAGFFADPLFTGKVLSPADVLRVSASFRDARGPSYEPANRLLIDPVLQFQPWLEFNRAMLRRGRLPLWNDKAGCGAPHLANGQSAVFDPFHAIAYLGRLPDAYAWMAAARLWVAGLGMFLLARSWRLGPWGRWFAGLCFPFSGFLVLWLLFPVTSVAVWMPWLLWAADRALERPGGRQTALFALVVGCVLLGGHVQTSAHVLLAGSVYVIWRLGWLPPFATNRTMGRPRRDQHSTLLGFRCKPQEVEASGGRQPPGFGSGQGAYAPRSPAPRSPAWAVDRDSISSAHVADRPKIAVIEPRGWGVPTSDAVAGLVRQETEEDRSPSRRATVRNALSSFGRLLHASRACWAGFLLGVGLAAVEVVPLGFYLAESPVWRDRDRVRRPPWEFSKPRLLDAVCTALPYAYGSQRRGHPNLARAIGVHNLNESAGGFAGLATLLWLAPLGWGARALFPRAWFLAGITVFGALGAFGLPPVDNLLRALPVLNVTDNRRLTLWVAFGLVLLGGAGIDALGVSLRERRRRLGARAWLAAAVALWVGASLVGVLEPRLRERSAAHYARAAAATPGADPAVYRERAERQVRTALEFLPPYWWLAGGQLAALAGLGWAWRRGVLGVPAVRAAVLGATLADLFAFGVGLNPPIAAGDERPESPVIAYLRREVGDSGRVLGVGEELPPNTLMRYGMSDIRNYDSVELSRSLAWFAPLYGPGRSARTSRREVTWTGVVRALDWLHEASVRAVVAVVPPPEGVFKRLDRVGDVWVARLDGLPLVTAGAGSTLYELAREPGRIEILARCACDERVVVRETFEPGWRAELDGRAVAIEAAGELFLSVRVPPGAHRLVLRYDPPQVRAALAVSAGAAIGVVFGLTGFRPFLSTRRRGPGLGRSDAPGLESGSDLHRTF
jgi:hypothetical protein